MLCDLSVNISTLWQFLTSLSTGHGLVWKKLSSGIAFFVLMLCPY